MAEPVQVRKLPTSFDTQATGPSSGAPLQLERPPSGTVFNPLPMVQFSIGQGPQKLCDANPNRITLMVRPAVLMTPAAMLYLFGPGGPGSAVSATQGRVWPLGIGEVQSLDITGEVWGAVLAGESIYVHVAEVTGPAQKSA